MINIRTELLYAPNYYWEWLSVLINGVDVAPVAPRPFATYGDAMQLLEVFIKETYLINRGAPGATRTGWQELEIRPSSPADALLVGNWHVLFYR
jgi:hypothetical protein